jgi:hypothetical protein
MNAAVGGIKGLRPVPRYGHAKDATPHPDIRPAAGVTTAFGIEGATPIDLA